MASAVVERDGRALLVRRAGGYLEGMWEFPSGPPRERDRDGARRGLSRTLAALGLRRRGEALATVRHTVVHRRLAVEVFRASGVPRLSPKAAARWFAPRELERAAIPTLTRKIARAAGFL
jgi:adenine-specific DNA glycosylase